MRSRRAKGPPVILRGGADPGAKYVCGRCADGYDVGIDKPTVPQPQIIMLVEPAGRTLPVKC